MRRLLLLLLAGGAAAISVPPMRLYGSAAAVRGDFGGRAAGEALCAQNQPEGCFRVGVLLSAPPDDHARNLFADNGAPVFGPGYQYIVPSWSNLFDDSELYGSMEVSGVASLWYAWTGSGATGYVIDRHCNNWTSASGAVLGQVGLNDRADSHWINDGKGHCNNANQLICLCYPFPPTSQPTQYPSAD